MAWCEKCGGWVCKKEGVCESCKEAVAKEATGEIREPEVVKARSEEKTEVVKVKSSLRFVQFVLLVYAAMAVYVLLEGLGEYLRGESYVRDDPSSIVFFVLLSLFYGNLGLSIMRKPRIRYYLTLVYFIIMSLVDLLPLFSGQFNVLLVPKIICIAILILVPKIICIAILIDNI